MAEFVVNILGAYLAAGFAFAVAFVTFGAGRLDQAAAHSGAAFRLMILPGSVVLWPILLVRWVRQ